MTPYATNTFDAPAAEKVAAQFYADVAPKINVREAQRALEKVGKEHAALGGA